MIAACCDSLAMMLRITDFGLCVFLFIGAFIFVGLIRKPHRRCPRCRLLNRPAARYCAQCGARLNAP